jgi:hypothetical protein
MRKIVGTAIVIISSICNGLFAQSLDWNVGFMGFADNREFNSTVQIPQSILGTQFIPELGINFDSIHYLGFGLNILQEFGSNKPVDGLDYQLYYKLEGDFFSLKFGSFSKNEVFKNAPKALYYDSLLYFRPNIKGLIWTLKLDNFRQSVYLDWTSRKADLKRETFIMGGYGKYSNEYIFAINHIYMYHYARANLILPDNHIRDNGAAYLSLGINLHKWIGFDNFTVAAGGLQSYERTRSIGDWNTPLGFLWITNIEHKGFGLNNTLYIGEGHKLDWGDPFYRLKKYDRLDIYFSPLRYRKVKATFGISLHFAESRIHHQQQFFIHVNLSQNGNRNAEYLYSYFK